MKRTMSRWSLFLLSIALALPLAADERAVKQREAGEAKVLNRVDLQPTSDSELVLEHVAIVDLEDGTQRVRIGTTLDEDRERRFFAKVDIAAKTYTAFRADSERIPQNVRERAAERANKRRLTIGTDDIYYPPNCGAPSGPNFEPCESPCSGDSNAALTAYDGAWNWLADTEGNLKYRRFGFNGCRWNSFMTGHCWANDNAGGKIWYTEGCNIVSGSPWLDGGAGTIEGKYFNTNGGNQSLRTNIRHWLRIDYFAPNSYIQYEYSFTGEQYTTFYIEFVAWQNGFCSPY